jgi:hypothetical protein
MLLGLKSHFMTFLTHGNMLEGIARIVHSYDVAIQLSGCPYELVDLF